MFPSHDRAGTVTIRQSTDDQFLVVTGYAERYFGPTPAPKFERVGGADVELLDQDFRHMTLDNNTPSIHATGWKQLYVFKDVPKSLHEREGKGINMPNRNMGFGLPSSSLLNSSPDSSVFQ